MVKVNLLPESRRNPSLFDGISRTMVLSIILVVLILVMIPVTIDRHVNNKIEENQQISDMLKTYNTAVASITPLKESYKAISERLQWYYSVAGTGLDPAAIMKEIQVTIPGDAWITSMALNPDRTVTLGGLALSFDSVSQFMSQIKLSPYFTYVDLQTTVLQPVGTQDAVSFQLKVLMNQA